MDNTKGVVVERNVTQTKAPANSRHRTRNDGRVRGRSIFVTVMRGKAPEGYFAHYNAYLLYVTSGEPFGSMSYEDWRERNGL